jgi:cobalamin-dependent methionine synthase I
VEAAQKQGTYLKAMLLHDLATTAVDALCQQFCNQLEIEAGQAGRHTSSPLSPGESSWPIEEQSIIFSLLETEQIGVTLTESLVMVPIKSLSLVVGEAQHAMGEGDVESCSYCTFQDRCRYRQLRGTAA